MLFISQFISGPVVQDESHPAQYFFGDAYDRFVGFHSIAEPRIGCSQGRIFSNGFPGGFYQYIPENTVAPRVISPILSFSPEEFVDGTSPIKPHSLSRFLNLFIFSISVRNVMAVI